MKSVSLIVKLSLALPIIILHVSTSAHHCATVVRWLEM